MTTTATIQKWGNSQGIRLSKQILEEAGMAFDSTPVTVEISVDSDSGTLKITKAKTAKRRRNIMELFQGYSDDWQPSEIDWGEPCGKEIW